MLLEMKNVRQIPKDGYRRWFTDDDYDLYVWYDDDRKNLIGFQLSYDKLGDKEHAITWREQYGYVHNKIDDGEGVASEARTPILVQDGAFDYDRVAKQFRKAAEKIDPEIRDFVTKKLEDY